MTDDLSPRELAEITGARSAARQAAWLARRGVPFRFGGGVVQVKRAVAKELPQWQQMRDAAPRMDLVA